MSLQYPDSSTSSDDDDPPPYPPPKYGQTHQPPSSLGPANIPPSESSQSLQSPDAVDTANDILLNLAGLPPFDACSPGSAVAPGAAETGAAAAPSEPPQGAKTKIGDMGAFSGDKLDGLALGATCAADTSGSAIATGGATAFPFAEVEETEIKRPVAGPFEDFSPTHQPITMPPKMSILDHDYTGSVAARKKRYRNWNPPMLGTLPDDFLRITVTPKASPSHCQTHPKARPNPVASQQKVASSTSSPRHQNFSPHNILSRSSVSPARPSLKRAETLPAKPTADSASSSPKIRSKDSHTSHQGSGAKSRTFGFRSRRQKSEAEARKMSGADEQLTNTLRKNPMAAAVS